MTQPPSQQPALPERVLAGAGAALLAAHVGGELADVALGTALGAPRAYFVSPAAACAVAAYALALPRGPWSDLLAQRTHYLIAFAALAWWASVLPTFALAFAATPLIGWWVFLADARGLVRYEVHDASFYVTRGTGYALMRAAPQAAVVHLGLDPRLARLAPLGVATLETLGMIALDLRSYAFGARSARFVTYALLKSAVFVCVPLLEEALLPQGV